MSGEDPAKVGPIRNEKGQFVPGHTGNTMGLGGRPPGISITKQIRDMLEADDGTELAKITQAIVDGASGGDFRFAQEIWNRIDGKTPDVMFQTNEVTVHDAASWPAGDSATQTARRASLGLADDATVHVAGSGSKVEENHSGNGKNGSSKRDSG